MDFSFSLSSNLNSTHIVWGGFRTQTAKRWGRGRVEGQTYLDNYSLHEHEENWTEGVPAKYYYRSGKVNSKSFVSKVFALNKVEIRINLCSVI